MATTLMYAMPGSHCSRAVPFDLAVGDMLNGSVYGWLTEVNGLHQLSAGAN